MKAGPCAVVSVCVTVSEIQLCIRLPSSVLIIGREEQTGKQLTSQVVLIQGRTFAQGLANHLEIPMCVPEFPECFFS